MDYKLNKLKNGLRVLIVPMPSLASATTTVWVKTGSRNEEQNVNGISHFLEHMVFKGGKKRPTAREISTAVDSIGGEFNAATSKDWTNFYIKSAVENLETAFDVLSDMVLSPILDKEEIEREKGTIVEEINMYEDTPMYRIGDVFEQLIFENSKLGWDIAGVEKTVRSITREDFVSYRNTHYFAENIIITVAGNVTEKKVNELVEKYFSNLKTGKKSDFAQEKFVVTQDKYRLKLHSKKKEQAHFILGFLSEGRGYKGRFAQSVMSAILGGGMSSRLFIEVRERRGLAYSVRSSMDRYDDVGYFSAYAGVDPKKAEEAVKIVLDQCYGLATGKYPISKAEINKSKEFIKGHLALALEDTKDVSTFFGEQSLFLDKPITPAEVYKQIEKVDIDQVMFEANKIFVKNHLNLAIIGPYTTESKFEKIIKG